HPRDAVGAAYIRAEDTSHPLESANAASIATLAWMDPLVRKGARQPLHESDIWPLATVDTAAAIHNRFALHWTAECAKPTPILARAIWRTFRSEIITALCLNVVGAALNLLQPWIVKSIVEYLQQGDLAVPQTSMGISSGYGLAGLLASASFLSITTGDYAQTLAAQIGCNAKSIFVDAVFLKTLALSGSAKAMLTSGDVVTMTTVDSEKMLLGFWYGFFALVCPVSLIVIMILM
ncbi:ATP-binding Cassette (ABC) Superfamily, partial [Achlya hypogyna]